MPRLASREIRQHCRLDEAMTNLLRNGLQESGLSARDHDKILRIARTIADLDGRAEMLTDDLCKAVNYRLLDRQLRS
jgi:magnesium chelatase family protein